MRLLLLFMLPVMGYSQLDTTITYKTKLVHSIVIKADSSTLSWKADTIKYDLLFEMKFTAAKIVIDGYGTYKITKHEIHGAADGFSGYHYFELSNGSKLTWIENAVIWDFPIVKKKTQTIIFQID